MQTKQNEVNLNKVQICRDCTHFHQYYVYRDYDRTFSPSSVGYCAYKNTKRRYEYETCDFYESGEMAAYIVAEDARKERAAMSEFMKQWRAEQAAAKKG